MKWEKMLVVDIECTCFNDADEDKPDWWSTEYHQEIIEIGCAMVDLRSREVVASQSFYARPVDWGCGKFCTDLTGITNDFLVDHGTLWGAMYGMRQWCRAHKFDIGQMPWGSWGDYDRVQFERETKRKGMEYPFGRSHFNVKGLFSILTGRTKGLSEGKACRVVGREFEGVQHRGVDDAVNAAELLLAVLPKDGKFFVK